MLKKIKTIIDAKVKRRKGDQPDSPRSISAAEYGITPKKISKGAQSVVADLTKAGYDAYVVGGCTRDILLGLNPKDFDVATNATPEQVNDLFRRSRIVGRRFQIVHVRMGREVIEVTTFRAHHEPKQSRLKPGKRDQSHRSEKGLLLRDNIFGSINDDASRRDFTMNALYYHPQDNTLYDFANGIRDIQNRTIRMIGEPAQRYREDPVRMLRAVRFAAKLGFDIAPDTAEPIVKMARLLEDIPPARLFDEVLKLFMNGHALATFHLLRQYRLFGLLFPETEKTLNDQSQDWMLPFIEQALANTDKRIRADKGVTPAFLFAALLWPAQHVLRQHYEQRGDSPLFAMQRAAAEITTRQCQRIAIPKRFSIPMREIWEMQLRLPRRRGKQALRLLEYKRFRAGYDFLLLREDVKEVSPGLGDWWTQFQEADSSTREAMIKALSGNRQAGGGSSNPRRRRKRKPAQPDA